MSNTTMNATGTQLPEWITVPEAAIITGVPESTLLQAAETGLLKSAPLVKGRKGGGILLVKVADLRACGFFGTPPDPQPAPASAVPAAPPTAVASPAAAPVEAPPVVPVETQPATPAEAPHAAPVETQPATPVEAPSPPTAPPAPPPPAFVVPPPPPPQPLFPPQQPARAMPAPNLFPEPAPMPPLKIEPLFPDVAPGPGQALATAAAPPAVRPAAPAPRPAPLPPLEPITRPPVPSSAEPLALGPQHERRIRPSRRKAVTLGVLAVIAGLAAGAYYVLHRPAPPPPKAAPVADGKPTSVALAVTTSSGSLVAVIGTPHDRPPVAMAIPDQTIVDLPDGLTTVGAASTSSNATLVATQSALQRRVGHAVVMTDQQLSGLIDSAAGIQVHTEAAFQFQGVNLGPGLEKLTGPEALAYIEAGQPGEDRTGRWEDVLTALFAARVTPSDWQTALSGDDEQVMASILAGAHGAQVIEMPTIEAGGGQLQPDRQGLAKTEESSYGSTLGPLVRVVVINGGGRPGVGGDIASRIAGAGYWVVSAQNATRFNVPHTKIVAASDSLVPHANEVQQLLNQGTVFVSDQETGIADITIVTGRDFRP
ncbi:MAG TPA: LCP family protein [Actinomycetota bacterium]